MGHGFLCVNNEEHSNSTTLRLSKIAQVMYYFPDSLLKTKNSKKTQPCNQKVNDNQRSHSQKISDWHCLLSSTPGQMKPRNLNGRSLRSVSSCFLVLPFVPRKPIIIQCTYMALIYGIVSVHSWTPFFLTNQTLQNLRDSCKNQPQTMSHIYASAVVTTETPPRSIMLFYSLDQL